MPDHSKYQEYREEAERLALLPQEDQQKIIAMHRETAKNPKAPRSVREEACSRAEALERHLRRLLTD
jgi:hypothetical protein